MFAGAMVGGLGGTLGATIGNIMIVGGDMVDNIYDLKKAVKELLAVKQIKNIQPSMESYISDSRLNDIRETVEDKVAPKVITLTPTQKGDQVVHEFVPNAFECAQASGTVNHLGFGDLMSDLADINDMIEMARTKENVDTSITDIGQKLKNNYFEVIPNILTSRQIHEYSKFYQKKLLRTCARYCLQFEKILTEEYGHKILGEEFLLRRRSLDIGAYTRNIKSGRSKAVAAKFLERLRGHITKNYRNLNIFRKLARRKHYKNVITFIENYKAFSSYMSSRSGRGKFSISRLKSLEGSIDLLSKSWLFENIRYAFPKKYGLPIRDNLLSWFLFRDSVEYGSGKSVSVKLALIEANLMKRFTFSRLLSIDYRINKLTTEDFRDRGIYVTEDELLKLQNTVSFLIYHFIFNIESFGDSNLPYISKTTIRNLEIGKYYFTPEYAVVRAIFFLAAEANNGVPLSLSAISENAGISPLNDHLTKGFGFGDISSEDISSYIESLLSRMPSKSNEAIIQNARSIIKGYNDIYIERRKEIISARGEINPVALGFHIHSQNIEPHKYSDLFLYRLEEAELLGGLFPFDVDNYMNLHPNDYARVSYFDYQIKVGYNTENKDKLRNVIRDSIGSSYSQIRSDKILVVDHSSKISNAPKIVIDLVKFAKDYDEAYKLGNMEDEERQVRFLRWPSHSGLATGLPKMSNYISEHILATEMPIYRKVGSKLVTGHPDFLIRVGDTLYVCDYKPNYHGDPMTDDESTTYDILSKSFIQSIPQVAGYAKILKKRYGVSKVVCVTFNKDCAWVYQDSYLEEVIEPFMEDIGISQNMVWRDYIY